MTITKTQKKNSKNAENITQTNYLNDHTENEKLICIY